MSYLISKMECQCQKGPCICETATCSNQNCPKSIKSQNIDDKGNTHYVESIYQKIPLDDFQSTKKQANERTSETTLYSKIKEDDDLNCNECCEHIYKPTIEQQRDCKIACNITAELYCQIRRQYAEPGEIISQCSNSSYLGSIESSTTDSERDDSDDNLGERSTEYVSARGRTFGSETSNGFDDDDVFRSTPVLCDHPSCCSLTPGKVCKHKKLIRKQSEEELVTINSDISHTSKKRNSGSRPKTRQKIEEANKQLADDEPAEHMPHEPKRIEIASNVTLFGKSDETLDTTTPPKRKKQKHTQKEPIRDSDENVSRSSKDGNNSSAPDLESDFSNLSMKYKNMRNQRHVTMPKDKNQDPSEPKFEVNARKRKYGSIHNDIFTEQRHSILSRESSYWPSRKKRITLKNFIAEEDLIKDEEDATPKKPVKTPPSKPEHRDAFYVLEKSTTTENKNPWKAYVPCERSDFTLVNKDTAKKNKGGMNFDSKFAQLTDRQQPMVRKIAVPYRPKKLLCFKYIPKITPVANNLKEPSLIHLYVDPPDPLPSVISKAKLLGSKIPVSMVKEKPEQKEKSVKKEKSVVRVVHTDEKPSHFRNKTLGDIPNVLEQRNMHYRRTTIPPEQRKSLLPKSLMSRPSKKRTTSDSSAEDGSLTSLRNKMRTFYTDDRTFSQESVLNSLWRQNKGSSGSNKTKIPKTCCSQTGIHVCIKESLLSRKGVEESNVIQMVNIDVTPKDSKTVKITVMPTVPEINKEGVITIPVQLQLYNQTEEEAKAKKLRGSAQEELLYQKSPATDYEHYLKDLREEMEGPSPKELRKEPLKKVPQQQIKQEEIQTDLTLGKKLLSKSLNSITSKESSSSVQNKSAPVKSNWIDWETIVLPPPGSFVIKQTPMKKKHQRRPSTKESDAPASTSVGLLLPPTEENRANTNRRNRFKLCCPMRRSRGESQRPRPVSKQSAKNKNSSNRREPPSQDDPEDEPSNIISFVFSKTDVQRINQPQHEDPQGVDQKPEIAWNNIVVPKNPHIKRVEKLDTSKTSTSITDQTETSFDEYFSKAQSTKTTDTCPNLSEDTYCAKSDKGTNTSIDGEEEDIIAVPTTRNRNVSANSMDILKAFKEDPVLSAFKAFEEELKPVRQALAEVQSKLRALNIPELECLFKKDPTSEYTLSHSNSQMGGEWRQPIYTYDNEHMRSSDMFDHYAGPSSDPRVYRLVLPTESTRSRNISTDMWKAFGSCDRNTIKSPYKKCWTSPHFYKMRTADSYNCPGAYYESRNSTPESDIEYVTFNSSGLCHGTLDKRFGVIQKDSYPPTYRNTPSTPPDHQFFGNSENSIPERVIPHFVASLQPKVSASFHAPSCKYNTRYIPLKVRPISPFFLPSDEGPILGNPRMSFIRPKTFNSKTRSIYAEPSEMHEYEALKYKQQQEYNFYKGYLRNERYL